jgi:ribosomal-protein-alanine N-acetyltransferase
MNRRKPIKTAHHVAQQATLRLRPMQAADLPAVMRLERQGQSTPWPAWCFRRLLRKKASSWVYEQAGGIIGFGIVFCARDWAHIMNLNIAPGYRRRGLGRRMLCHLLQQARRRGAVWAWLEVRPDNRVAIALYKNLGFRLKGRRRNYYRQSPKGRRDALVMRCNLGAVTVIQ